MDQIFLREKRVKKKKNNRRALLLLNRRFFFLSFVSTNLCPISLSRTRKPSASKAENQRHTSCTRPLQRQISRRRALAPSQ